MVSAHNSSHGGLVEPGRSSQYIQIVGALSTPPPPVSTRQGRRASDRILCRVARPGAPMRVLHHVWRLSQSGGIPVVVRNLALGLDPARFELHVSTVRPRLSEDALEALDGHLVLHPLNVRGSTRLPRARAVSGLARVTARLRPDVLHLHSGTGWQASGAMAFASKAARILEVHDAPGAGQHGAFTERVEAGMVRRLRFHPLVHSRSVAATVEAATGVEATLIPLGIDTKRFAASSTPRDEWRRSNGIPLDEMLVVWVGRLVPNKNLSLALGVMQRLAATAHPPHLAVIGAGDESSVLDDHG